LISTRLKAGKSYSQTLKFDSFARAQIIDFKNCER
jgi:hypothetical protein